MKQVLRICIVCAGLLLSCLARARADNYALLIGIDKYDHGLSELGGAANDARALAQTLIDVCKFPAGNVTVLVSDDKRAARGAQDTDQPLRPDRNGILQALTLLTKRVKVGDLVFLFYAGHGVQPDSVPYLLPQDCLDDEQNLTESALPVTVFGQRLAKLKAKTLIMAFDMCRSLPFGGSRDTKPDNHLSDAQVRGVAYAFSQAKEKRETPLSTVMLFACSPKESSYEWLEKKRGYFSYFLEQGLRCDGELGGASDAQGVVKVEYLVKYLQKAVPGAIQLHETRNIAQTPYPNVDGPDAMQTVLATDRPHQSAGDTAVSLVVGTSADDHFDSIFQRGVELYDTKQYERAEIRFEDALELRPGSAPAIYLLGSSKHRQNKYGEAEKLFQRAMLLDPTYSRPVNDLGVIYKVVNHNYVEAKKLFRKAMDIDPTDPYPVNNLGNIYLDEEHDYAEAERLFRKAIELDPKNTLPINNLGNLFYLKHDYSEAEKFLRKAMQLDPRDSGTVVRLGFIYEVVKHDYLEAERLYRKAIQLDPSSAFPVNFLAKLCLIVKRDYIEAERLFRKAIILDPNYGGFHAYLAESLLKQGKKSEATKEAKQAISLGYKVKHPVFDLLGLKP